jgi:hypothetical protein
MKSINISDVTYHFSSPIVSIWIKDEARLVSKGNIKDVNEYQNGQGRQPLQPCCAACPLVIRRKGKQRQNQHNHYLKLLSKIHGDGMYLVIVGGLVGLM